MKRLFTLLLISFAALSCEMVDEKLDDLLDKRDWVVFAEGTELTANVPSKQTVLNYKFESALDWEVKTGDEWLEIDPMSGKAGKDIKIQIKVAKNKEKTSRTGYVHLSLTNNESYHITINQAGEGDENDDIVVEIPNNQIWYTSTDGEIVEPYSGEYNNNAETITTFGVNIVSNTYVDGKGVIEFDGDVTTIGYVAFYNCSNLTSVTIPDSVTTIGECVFAGCTSLTSVVIGDSVTTIGYGAFSGCASLTSVTIPDSVTTIGYGAFSGCSSLTSITIPDSVTTISEEAFSWCLYLTSVTIGDGGKCAFSSCSSLTSVTIGNSVTEIGDYAFYACESLIGVTIPDSVTTIGEAAFGGCSLQEFKGKFASEDGRCLIIDGVLNSFAPGGLVEYTIPDSVTMIGYGTFSCSYNLTSVTIPNSVTTIGDYAFQGCSSLESLTIPDSVTSIGYTAFVLCGSLQEFNGKFASEDGRCLIVDGTLISFAPAGLTEYTIPNSVTSIGDRVFNECRSLTSITLPDSVTMIGGYAFEACTSLTSVTIPDSVTSIEEGAFHYCIRLTSVTIGDSVTTIGNSAFSWCESLTSVYCKPTTPPVALFSYVYWEAFDSNASGREIYVPMESIEAYKSAEGWKNYASDIVGYNF